MKYKMKYLNVKQCAYLTFLVLWAHCLQSEASQLCPSFCNCDFYQERNRAVCSAKRLISPNVEVPAAVEILDLSFNDITSLDNSCFQNYHFLSQLNLSHNAIETIYLDAFSKLRRIQTIDLSHNRLEYLDERLFEANRNLQMLNLAGNKFISLPNKPLLFSRSLLTLNLRNSQLHHLPTMLLSGVPQLQQLDLSENLMITLSMAVFEVTPLLRHINLMNNRWICDQSLQQTLALLQKRAINVEIIACVVEHKKPTQQAIQKFERLKMLETPSQQSLLESEADVAKSAEKLTTKEVATMNWRRLEYSSEDDDDDDKENIVDEIDNVAKSKNQTFKDLAEPNDVCLGTRAKLCQRYRKCLEKVSHILLEKTNVHRNGIYTDNDLNMAFLLGTAVGITFVIVVMSCALCCKGCYLAHKIRKTQAVLDNEIATPTLSTTLLQPVTQPPPTVPQRRIRRPRRSPPITNSTDYYQQQAVVRHSDDRDNFLSRLFGRPARHQYYRTINENTATLIRRLSRSNLFNNRLSQHFNDRTPTTPTTPPLNSNRNDFNYDIVAENFTPATAQQRPETPPPKYGDCVDVASMSYDRKNSF